MLIDNGCGSDTLLSDDWLHYFLYLESEGLNDHL